MNLFCVTQIPLDSKLKSSKSTFEMKFLKVGKCGKIHILNLLLTRALNPNIINLELGHRR